ncbi:hypothetical protein AAF712_007633 [Marasmius tenuissimus]|uniref:Protein kinase domain-containing protein n=1 Tax=Marasmius tenuissimus TaxID=585030 RepID=A0ABR2ZXA9_9AGAR
MTTASSVAGGFCTSLNPVPPPLPHLFYLQAISTISYPLFLIHSTFKTSTSLKLMNGEIEYTSGLSLQTINYGSDQVISNNTFINLSHKTLWDKVAGVGASHTAEQQYDRGECLEGTRVEHRRMIHEWTQARGEGCPLFWLTGAAGVGKTAIAMSAAKACEQEGLLVSSFFFFRSDPKRNNPQALWLSVAHGLVSTMPVMRRLIEQRISEDPRILEARSEDQFRELVFNPVTRQSGLRSFSFANAILSLISTVQVPNIVIIDGLDECSDEYTQLRILSIIRDAVQQAPRFPLRFLICSRPESWIREAFTSEPFRGLSEALQLDDELGAAEDITKYFRHHFQEIVSNPKYKHILFPDPWPSQEYLETLVDRSCNQFLYVKSVVRLITLASKHPVNELRLILDNSPTNRHTLERLYYPELDALYHTILAATPYREEVHTILVAILVLPTIKYPDIDPLVLERYLPPTPAHIELLLGLSEGQVVLMLRGMHSVLRIGGQTDEITLHHTSFRDFLFDQIRSGDFHIDLAAQKHIVAQRWLETLTTNKMLVSSSDLVADAHEDVSSFEEVNTEEDFDDDEGTCRLELNLDEEMFCEPVNEIDDGDKSDSTSEDLPPTTPGEAQKYEKESLSNSNTHYATISKATERTSPIEVTGPAEGTRTDEEFERVQAFFKDDTKCRKVLDTRGDEAQRWLDLLQALTAYPEITKQSRSTIFKIMWRLSKKSRMYPKCLKINNVKKLDEYPVAAGGMGDVYKGEIAAEIVCLKVVKVYQTSDVQQGINEFMQEAIVWQQLRHPNILPFVGMYYLDKDQKQLCLVSPWMEQGNLVTFLKKAPPALVDHMLLASDIASGLAHLHDMSIVHGDMKGVNVLITPELRACIGDFGLSRVRDSDALRLSTSIASRAKGTTHWFSPELLDPDSPSFNSTVKSDMYAYGCVCYEASYPCSTRQSSTINESFYMM